MREMRYQLRPVFESKRITVVGGGPAGMEAAMVTAQRGHAVTLLEKQPELGGYLIQAGSHSFKKEVSELNRWFRYMLRKLKVDVRTGVDADPAYIEGLKPDVVILAAGYDPVLPNIEGIHGPHVLDVTQAYRFHDKIGDRPLIIGGGLVGCELALGLAMEGKPVTVVEALDRLMTAGSEEPPIPNRQMIVDLFEEYGVRVLTGHKVTSIGTDQVTVSDGGTDTALEADTVIVAAGFRPAPSMKQGLSGKGFPVYEIRGQQIGTIMRAVWDAYEIANNI